MTALWCVMLNSDNELKSSGLVALRCAFPQLKHDGIAMRHAQYLIVGALVTWAIYTQGQLLL